MWGAAQEQERHDGVSGVIELSIGQHGVAESLLVLFGTGFPFRSIQEITILEFSSRSLNLALGERHHGIASISDYTRS